MRRLSLSVSIAAIVALSSGCESLYDNYVQVATELMLLQVNNDLDDTVSLDAPFDGNHVEVHAYLYEARNLDELGNVPAEGATVLLEGENMSRRALQEQGDGYYYLDNSMDDKLRYLPYQDFQLTIYYAGKERKAWFFLPEPPNMHVPSEHPAGQPMPLDLDPPDFDGAVAMVFDADGALIVDERPTSLDELMAITEMGDTPSVTLDGESFPLPGAQAVGVGGVRVTRGSENFENMDNEDCRMAAAAIDLSLVDVY